MLRVAVVSRKPLVGSVAQNALKHGTGGLNIEVARVGTTDSLNGGAYAETGTSRADGWGMQRAGAGVYQQPTGRWPSNLILQHQPGCQRVGTKKVKAITGTLNGAWRYGHQYSGGWAGADDAALGSPVGFGDAEGMETIEAWDCTEDCPVAGLDAQSGEIPAQKIRTDPTSRLGNPDKVITYFGLDRRKSRPPEYLGEQGGASRFFKQIAWRENDMPTTIPQDLVDYLLDLISPPPPALRAVYVPTLEGLDLSETADLSLTGMIARGTPTEEQARELLRVLLPGAHLILIAPDENPVGDLGACVIEDGGFEIRDSILLVDEDQYFHYVPKAARAEREAGCRYLPGKTGAEAVDRDEETAGLQSPRAGAGRTAGVVRNFHPCLHPEALVMTDWGYRPIGEIHVGDRVYAADGCFHAVEAASRHPYTSEYLYEIHVRGTNYTTPASDNHPFLIWRPTRKGNYISGGGVLWVMAKDILKGDYTMTPVLREAGAETHWGPDFWFLFGLWLAEGVAQRAGHGDSVYPSYSLHEEETNLVERIKQFFKPRGAAVGVYPKPDSRGVQVVAFDAEVGREFVALGSRGAYSKSLHPSVFSLPLDRRKAVVQGHLAGDGGRVRTYHQAKTASPDLASQLFLLAGSVGFRANLFRFDAEPGHIGDREFQITLPSYQIQLYERNLGHQNGGTGRKPSWPTTIEHEGQTFFLNYVQAVVEVPHEGEVVNLTVGGSPTFLTAVGMSHNTVKPIELMERLLADVPLDQGPVVDNFCGSGSTLLACVRTGHEGIGIEKDPEYLQIAEARVRHMDSTYHGMVATEIVSEAPPPPEPKQVSLFDLLNATEEPEPEETP